MPSGNMLAYVELFLQTKDAAKAAATIKSSDKLVVARTEELTAIAREQFVNLHGAPARDQIGN